MPGVPSVRVQLFYPHRGCLLNDGRQISVLPLRGGRCHNTRHRAVLLISDERSGHNTDPQMAFFLGSTDFSIGTTTWTAKPCERVPDAAGNTKGIDGAAADRRYFRYS